MAADIQTMRKKICELGRLLFDRKLTDAFGGNISARVGEQILITPRYAGAQFNWQLKPEQIILASADGKKLEGSGEMSRESRAHFQLYQEFPQGNGIVHGHARNILAFCAAGVPIPPILESNFPMGEIGLCEFAPAITNELAESIVKALRKKEDALNDLAACVMAPWHGIFALAKTIDDAYNAVELIDNAAYIILMTRGLSSLSTHASSWAERTAILKEEIAAYGKQSE